MTWNIRLFCVQLSTVAYTFVDFIMQHATIERAVNWALCRRRWMDQSNKISDLAEILSENTVILNFRDRLIPIDKSSRRGYSQVCLYLWNIRLMRVSLVGSKRFESCVIRLFIETLSRQYPLVEQMATSTIMYGLIRRLTTKWWKPSFHQMDFSYEQKMNRHLI